MESNSMAELLAALPSDEQFMEAIAQQQRHEGSGISLGGEFIPTTGASTSTQIAPTPQFLANAVIEDEDDGVTKPEDEDEDEDVLRLVDLPVAEGAGGEAEVHDPAGYAEAVVAPEGYQGDGGPVDPNAREFIPTWKIRSKLLGDPAYLQPAMSPRSSRHVAGLLEAGDQEVCGIVLAGVTSNARLFMESPVGGVLFVPLLGRPELQLGDLENILNAALGGPQKFDNPDWVSSLEALITAVAHRGSPDLRTRLVRYLQDEGVMNHAGGGEVLAHCLTIMPYEEAKALIRHALDTINDKLESEFGSRCMSVCFRHSRADELLDFRKVVCKAAIDMAMGRYSNYLMQDILEHGVGGIQYAIVDELMKDVAGLSSHEYGHFVLQACLLKTGESQGELLRRLLEAFVRLPNEQLAQMAQAANSSAVLSLLFDTARTLLPEDRRARALAQKIRAQRAALPENADTRLVMESIEELLSTGR